MTAAGLKVLLMFVATCLVIGSCWNFVALPGFHPEDKLLNVDK